MKKTKIIDLYNALLNEDCEIFVNDLYKEKAYDALNMMFSITRG
jgi:quinolinate synthase